MQNRKVTRLLASILSMAMLISLAGCGAKEEKQESKKEETKQEQQKSETSKAEESSAEEEVIEGLEWLNIDGLLPIVKEGEEKSLSLMVRRPAEFVDPEETWFYQFIEENMNIDLEIDTYQDANRGERISLAFAADELSDIIIAAHFSVSELLNYGASEGQLLDLAPYINETYMPNLTRLVEEYPYIWDTIKDAEGHVWSLGLIGNSKADGYYDRAYINYDWLDECGLEVPTTIDEFLDTMKAFKDKGLAEYPVAGKNGSYGVRAYIMNALGYVITIWGGEGTHALRNGEFVIPYADREAFPEYLRIMHEMYEEGLIHKDFYTMDDATMQAEMAKGMGFINQAPFVFDSNWTRYWGALPLTSDYNDTPQWTYDSAVTIGTVAVTSACEEPELAVRFIDYFYGSSEDYGYKVLPMANEGFLDQNMPFDCSFGVETVVGEDNQAYYKDYYDNQDLYPSEHDYMRDKINIWGMSYFGYDEKSFLTYEEKGMLDMSQYDNLSELRNTLPELTADGNLAFRYAIVDTCEDYLVDPFPYTVWITEEENAPLKDIKTACNQYANQEIAKFVVGERELTDAELTDFFDTLDGLGIQDYIAWYQDYYNKIK